MNYADLDALHAAIGEGHVSAQSVAQRVARELRGGDHEVQLPSTARQPRRATSRQGVGVHVEGLDDVMVRLSRCCTPVPGDEIIGFVTRGRGVSVHRSDCANAATLSAGEVGRMIEVEWDRGSTGQLRGRRRAQGARPHPPRRRRVEGASPTTTSTSCAATRITGADRVSRMRFEFELADPAHLESLLVALKRIDSVYDAYRVLPNRGN